MSAHNFWNNFTHGFMHGMFNNNPFFGCMNFGWSFNSWCNPFNSCFTPFPASMYLYPNVMSGVSIFPLMPNITMPPMPNFRFNMEELFPTDNWNRQLNNNFLMGDVFEKNSINTSIGETNISSPAKANLSSASLSALKGKHWTEMTDSEMKLVYGDYTRDITKPYNGTVEDLNKYLKGMGVLEGQGQAFLDAQKEYGISASVIVGIAMIESGKGISKNARQKNNVGGVRIPGSTKFKSYSSVAECINDMARFLKSGYVNNKEKALTKLYQINAKYCPTADPTDSNNLNSYWARNVDKYASEVERV